MRKIHIVVVCLLFLAVLCVEMMIWRQSSGLEPTTWQNLHDRIESYFIPLACLAGALAAYFAYLIPFRIAGEQTLPALIQRYNSDSMLAARSATMRGMELWYSNDRNVLHHFTVQNHKPPMEWESAYANLRQSLPTQILNFGIEIVVARDAGFVSETELQLAFRDRYQWYVAYLKGISEEVRKQHKTQSYRSMKGFLRAQDEARNQLSREGAEVLHSVYFNWLNYLDRLIGILKLEPQSKQRSALVPQDVLAQYPSDPDVLRMILSATGDLADFGGAKLLAGSQEPNYPKADAKGLVQVESGFYRLYYKVVGQEYFIFRLIVFPWGAYATRWEQSCYREAKLLCRRIESFGNGVIYRDLPAPPVHL